MRSKISIIGAGNVGAACAQRILEHGNADVVLMDVIEGMPQGKALDMLEAWPIIGYPSTIIGTNNYDDTAGSDIVIITSGAARKPGMSRDDLLNVNRKIITDVTENIAKRSPHCIILMVTNPLDAMAQLALKVSGFPRRRVIGMSGVLDTARFRTFLAFELKVSVGDITALVLGGHGDTMVPLLDSTAVCGVPVTKLLSRKKLAGIVERTRGGGAEIVALLQAGSAYYAPSAGVAQIVEAILLDKKQILPCSAYLDGEYGIKGLFLGVPVKLGARGIEKIIRVKLTVAEDAALKRSAAAVKELVDLMGIG